MIKLKLFFTFLFVFLVGCIAGAMFVSQAFTGIHAKAPSGVQKWQYFCAGTGQPPDSRRTQRFLNKFGASGWEAYLVTSRNVHCFKRPAR